MEGAIQLGREEVDEIIKDFGLKPTFNKIIVTLNMVEDEDGLIITDEGISEVQYVVAAGDRSFAEPGQKIALDMAKLVIKDTVSHDQYQTTSSIQIKPVTYNGIAYAIMSDNVIEYIFLNE